MQNKGAISIKGLTNRAFCCGYMTEQGAIPVDDYPKISQTLKEVEDAPMTYDLLRVSEWKGEIFKKAT